MAGEGQASQDGMAKAWVTESGDHQSFKIKSPGNQGSASEGKIENTPGQVVSPLGSDSLGLSVEEQNKGYAEAMRKSPHEVHDGDDNKVNLPKETPQASDSLDLSAEAQSKSYAEAMKKSPHEVHYGKDDNVNLPKDSPEIKSGPATQTPKENVIGGATPVKDDRYWTEYWKNAEKSGLSFGPNGVAFDDKKAQENRDEVIRQRNAAERSGQPVEGVRNQPAKELEPWEKEMVEKGLLKIGNPSEGPKPNADKPVENAEKKKSGEVQENKGETKADAANGAEKTESTNSEQAEDKNPAKDAEPVNPAGNVIGEQEFAQIEKELAEQLGKAKNSRGEDLSEGEKLALARDFYLKKLNDRGNNYSIKHQTGFGGRIGRFFAFASGREDVLLTNDGEAMQAENNKPRKFRINWMHQTPGQDLVDFLKNELKNQVGKKAAETKVDAAGEVAPKTPEEQVVSVEQTAKKVGEILAGEKTYQKSLNENVPFATAVKDGNELFNAYAKAFQESKLQSEQDFRATPAGTEYNKKTNELSKVLADAEKAFQATELGKKLVEKHEAWLEIGKALSGASEQA